MEEQRFDDLAKTFARPVSRRQMVKVLVTTTVGGWFVRSGTGKAFAGTCTPNSACAHFCTAIFGGDTANQSACAMEATKCQGLCWTCGPGANPSHLTPCPGGTLPGTSFPGHCANLQTDKNNCGACNHACGSSQVCHNGSCCTPKTCAAYPGLCGSESNGCGGTITCSCTSPQVCYKGSCCTPATCQPGQCGSIPDGCGGTLNCGNVCTAGTCCGGVCCNLDENNCCSNVCVKKFDSNNCGGCGVVCPAGQSCCFAQTQAGGVCTNTSTDNNNCGTCGNVCTAGTCCGGVCCNLDENNCCNGTCQATPC